MGLRSWEGSIAVLQSHHCCEYHHQKTPPTQVKSQPQELSHHEQYHEERDAEPVREVQPGQSV